LTGFLIAAAADAQALLRQYAFYCENFERGVIAG
jgi:hypothetical protein